MQRPDAGDLPATHNLVQHAMGVVQQRFTPAHRQVHQPSPFHFVLGDACVTLVVQKPVEPVGIGGVGPGKVLVDVGTLPLIAMAFDRV